MNNNTNEEKLKILQERLNQIKQKEEGILTNPQNQEVETQTNSDNINQNTEEEKKKSVSFKWLKFIVIIIALTYAIVYLYNENSLKSEKTNIKVELAKESQTTLQYNFKLEGHNIAIIATFDNEESAKAQVNDLKIKGFKCDYFYLPNISNSTEEVFKVFIGPYENLKETNQWGKNLKAKLDIIPL